MTVCFLYEYDFNGSHTFQNILFETSYLYMSFLTNNLIIFYIIRRTSGTFVYPTHVSLLPMSIC